MKFHSLLLLGLALFVSCAEALETVRRRKKKGRKKKHHTEHVYVGSTVTLAHVHGNGTAHDVDDKVLVHALTNAFNKLHYGGPIVMDDGIVSKEWAIREDDDDGEDQGHKDGPVTVGRYNPFAHYYSWQFAVSWSGHCDLCSPFDGPPGDDYFAGVWDDYYRLEDSAASLLLKKKKKDHAAKHKALEAEVCNELRATGIESMRELSHCFVQFLYSAAMAPATSSEHDSSPVPAESTASLHAQLNVDHVLNLKFGPTALDMVGDIFAECYNLIHSGWGYKITAVEFLRRIDLPENPTPPQEYFDRMWWVKADYECDTGDCRLLPPVDAFPRDEGLHKAFEDLVCLKLKDSGLPAYKKARYCEVSFGLNSGELGDLVDAEVTV